MTNFVANDGEYMFLAGSAEAPLFLFIHGYASAPQDTLPLAQYINEKGYNCALVFLMGHGRNAEAMTGLQYADWVKQSRAFCQYYKRKYKNVYLIGFSLGATLCLHLASEEAFDGVVAISTFIRPPTLARRVLQLAEALGLKRVPRLLQVTHKATKREIVYSKYFLVRETASLIAATSQVTSRIEKVKCPVLFLHSTDDKVSDYWTIASMAKSLAPNNSTLVTFRCLKHFLHFDVPLSSLFPVIEAFFWTDITDEDPKKCDFIKDALTHASEELRHWSGMVFQLIVGFFSVFGALVYFSLPDVLGKKGSAPYFLASYSMLASFFLVLLALYFFYVNRVNVFLKHHIEPYLPCVSWTSYRTSNIFAGRESERMTNQVSLAVVGLPLAISIGSIIYTFVEYGERFFVFEPRNILLMAAIATAIVLNLSATGSLIVLSKYTKRELYRIPVAGGKFRQIQAAVQSLYLSVSPGVVAQRGKWNTEQGDITNR